MSGHTSTQMLVETLVEVASRMHTIVLSKVISIRGTAMDHAIWS
jgi:hypothetical protein